MFITTYGVGVSGRTGLVVSVQLHRTRGARFHVSGIPWSEARTSFARIFAAFESCGYPRPTGAFTLHVSPKVPAQCIQWLDVPFALAFLASLGIVEANALTAVLSMGELGLDGSVQPDRETILDNDLLNTGHCTPFSDCYLPKGGSAIPFPPSKMGQQWSMERLPQLVLHLQGGQRLPKLIRKNRWAQRERRSTPVRSTYEQLNLSELEHTTLLVSAAANLSVLIIGSPGTGKSQMARALHELLPNLNAQQSTQLARWHALRNQAFRPSETPPFRAPHHRCSASGLTGTFLQGRDWIPGELSLASYGILCLDELNEFSRDCIESLRGPMEFGEITLVRSNGTQNFPAPALIVGTANPCLCGHLHEGNQRCACTPHQVKRHLMRISGPVAERFALHLEAQPRDPATTYQASLTIARTIAWRSREFMARRNPIPWSTSARAALTCHLEHVAPSPRGEQFLRRIAEAHAIVQCHRAEPHVPERHRIHVTEQNVQFAGQLRIFDRPNWWAKAPIPHFVSD